MPVYATGNCMCQLVGTSVPNTDETGGRWEMAFPSVPKWAAFLIASFSMRCQPGPLDPGVTRPSGLQLWGL